MSSSIFVLVGQCGNQLGEAILTMSFEARGRGQAGPSPFFCRDGKARCVLVDSEPKAIEGVMQRSTDRYGAMGGAFKDGGIFRRENVVTGNSGRGNCWGLGYHGLAARVASEKAFKAKRDQREGDAFLLQRALCAVHAESCRVEDERAGIDAIVVVHSLAGGTGSGFCSKLVEKLELYFQKRTCLAQAVSVPTPRAGPGLGPARGGGRQLRDKYDEADDEAEQDRRRRNPNAMGLVVSEEELRYWRQLEDASRDADGLDAVYGSRRQAAFIIAFSVAPMRLGENAVQGINATLTLNSLLQSAHAVILLRNDEALNGMPQPLTMPTVTASASSRGAAPSATSGMAYRAPQSMDDMNAVFAAMLCVVLDFGLTFGAIGDLMGRLCPLNPPGGGGGRMGTGRAWGKVISLVPLPQRVFSRFQHCASLSAVFRLPTDMFGAHLAADYSTSATSGAAVIPFETIHEQCRPVPAAVVRGGLSRPAAPLPDGVSSEVRVTVPKPLLRIRTAADAPLQLWPVLALNQRAEVNREVLFPLLRDCHAKVSEDAFVHTFEQTGVKKEYILACIKRVAAALAESE